MPHPTHAQLAAELTRLRAATTSHLAALRGFAADHPSLRLAVPADLLAEVEASSAPRAAALSNALFRA